MVPAGRVADVLPVGSPRSVAWLGPACGIVPPPVFLIQIMVPSRYCVRIRIAEPGRRLAVTYIDVTTRNRDTVRTETAPQYGWKTTALRAVVGVLCLGWIATSAMAACLPYVAVDAPVSDHTVLEQTHDTGDVGDECCVSAHHAVLAPALAAASSCVDPEPPVGIGVRDAAPHVEQESAAPAARIEGVASIAHPPLYLLYSRLLIPHLS